MHSLDEFDAEPAADRLLNVAPAGQPSSRALAYLSRAESRLARHRRHSLGAAMRRLTSRVRDRLATAVGSRGATERDQDSDGVIIATLLVIVTVAYGVFLTAASAR